MAHRGRQIERPGCQPVLAGKRHRLERLVRIRGPAELHIRALIRLALEIHEPGQPVRTRRIARRPAHLGALPLRHIRDGTIGEIVPVHLVEARPHHMVQRPQRAGERCTCEALLGLRATVHIIQQPVKVRIRIKIRIRPAREPDQRERPVRPQIKTRRQQTGQSLRSVLLTARSGRVHAVSRQSRDHAAKGIAAPAKRALARAETAAFGKARDARRPRGVNRHHTADRIRSVDGRRRAAQHFDAADGQRRQQPEIRIAIHRIGNLDPLEQHQRMVRLRPAKAHLRQPAKAARARHGRSRHAAQLIRRIGRGAHGKFVSRQYRDGNGRLIGLDRAQPRHFDRIKQARLIGRRHGKIESQRRGAKQSQSEDHVHSSFKCRRECIPAAGS